MEPSVAPLAQKSMEEQHLDKAPISEAAIDVQVDFDSPPSMSAIREFSAKIAASYPIANTMSNFESSLEIGPEKHSTSVVRTDIGMRCESLDHKQIVQARTTGCTYSLLEPYSNWAAFSATTKGIWVEYLNFLKPRSVKRLGVRFVNKIEPGLPASAIVERLLTRPFLSKDLSADPEWFFVRMELPSGSFPARVLLTEILEPTKNGTNGRLIFDIDAFVAGSFPPSSSAVWDEIAKLRAIKNKVFFSSFARSAKEWFT